MVRISLRFEPGADATQARSCKRRAIGLQRIPGGRIRCRLRLRGAGRRQRRPDGTEVRHRNLVSNAVRCGKAAKVTVSETGEGAEIILTGRGPGLPEEKLLEVFEPYKRLDTSRSRETCGMGLGFAIVKTLWDRIGATNELTNCPEGGLYARLWLPRG
ncbi:MAG TPA: hypothetical protein DCG58_13750 [Hyphomonas adhaerens]|uniref:histidine kinase n=1 Tax=Hyphomonas adhaerens TaxID=81029 RepID=A0A3B9H0J0_9PROT|nr:ATP-binding protein [Hyphomonas sp.]MBB40310.1 hypothetical protein [Hyphomonas sp.]HAE28222.1 hypothetical protein [Hyphomonas adhaerens]|tara:strand:+ start:2196 stop:2669 length:474 start_codon:yes stop_codon:yes gene_type:complete